jgi:hypothetical protein
MNKWVVAMAAAGFLVFGAETARAAVLAESNRMMASGVLGRPIDEPVAFSFGVYNLDRWTPGPTDPPESERRPVFNRLPLGENNVGQTIFVPASQIPGAIELLTNGTTNVVSWELWTTSGSRNSAVFTDSVFLNPPRGRLDFAGQEVTAIGVRVNSLRLNDPSTGVYAFDLSLVVVPEPSSGLAVLGLGALALLRRRRAV